MTDRLVEEGFISFEQAELAAGTDGMQSSVRLDEVLGYFGAIAVFVATIALMVEVAFSDNFLFGGIDNIPGGLVTLVGTAVVGWAGWNFTAATAGAVKRAGGFLLASAFGLWAVTVALLLQDLDAGDFTPIIVVAPIVAGAWFIWNRFQSVPTHLVAFVTVTQIASALLVLFQVTEYRSTQETILRVAVTGSAPASEWIPAVVGVAIGLGWLWATYEGFLKPRNAGFAIGSLYAAFNGLDLFSTADGWVVLFACITLFVLYGGLTWRSSVLLAIGAIHVIILIIMLMTILLDQITAMQVTLWFGLPGVLALGYVLYRMSAANKTTTGGGLAFGD